MNTGEDEPSSGLNGRLRPRKSNIPSPKTAKNIRKPDTKPALDKPKRTSTPSKAFPNKPDDLINKSDSPATQILCPYCDKTFFAKQAVSKHVRRVHLSTSKQDNTITCLFCNHVETDANDIVRHMVDNHPNQYFACYDCHTRFPSTTELAEHKLNVCEKQKLPYRNKLRQKVVPKRSQKNINGRNDFGNDVNDFPEEHGFNGIVISCEVKSSHDHDLADIEDNITTNFILPPGKNLVNGTVIEKNAVIILDDLQWNKRIPSNFSFQNTDADQILSRLGVVHRSPRTGESHGREWPKIVDDLHQKFEKCFDTGFYSKVASNVQENLTKFLDGSCNFNPDPENTIKTRKAKNSVAINTVEGFPILLACEQFSRNVFDGYMPRAIAPKHKWKWDNLENDKSLMSPEQIKRDSHTNNCIISLVSSLDIWTQLCMRRKFEIKFNKSAVQRKTEKQSIIGQELKEILESRELPASSSQVVKYTGPTLQSRSSTEFPASLGLVPTAPSFDLKPAVLSGEWVRPRCYVCCACGEQTSDPKGLSLHISTQHPNAQIQHYEIVGEVLLNSDILKHLYVPPNQMINRTRPLRGIRECTKCKKSISLEDLHQHMLDCAGDTPAVRRKCRYRPFGVRKRRPRLPDNTIRKKIRKDIRTRHSRKNHMRPRPRIRTEVGDAETIRKMLADLPAKRHRVMVKPLNPTIRPRKNLNKTRNKLVMKKRLTEEIKNSQGNNSSQVTGLGAEGSKKSPRDPEERPPTRSFKSTVKRVASKILRKKDAFNKNSVNKSKRKTLFQKDSKVSIAQSTSGTAPESQKETVPIDQLSIENNSERINVGDGSCNTREHGNRSNNNSYNRDSQSPEANNGQNSNSRDSFAPSQNVPLKHSIASLTASSETHDKSVQFHHLFLIQQECNNVNQHLPTGQRMLFENEAVVTKLDKPPLHFSRSLDLQAFQKSKLNKPRKGLNDCIAMLKNKLVEPSPDILPGHVSVQCGNDEPLEPDPIIVERRHSTTDLNTDFVQRSDYLHMHVPKKAQEDNVQYTSSKNKTTRRSGSRHGHSTRSEKSTDILSNNELMQWRQFYYDTQMFAAQNTVGSYTKREYSRRRSSLVPTDDLLLQHAMNLELLNKSSNDMVKFSDYHHYPTVPTHHSQKRNHRRDSQKNKVQSTKSKTRDNSTRGKNASGTSNTKQTQRSKSVINSSSTKRNVDKHQSKYGQLNCNSASSIEKNTECYPQTVIEDPTPNLNVEKDMSFVVNKSPVEHQTQNLSHNTPPVLEYMPNSDVPPAHYTMHLEAVPSGPLDLSNKISNTEDTVQYATQEQYAIVEYDVYETLDLSNKNLAALPVTETQINSDDVVDLSVNYASHLPFQSRYTRLPPDIINNEIEEDNATDLSLRRDDDLPTDLSMNRRSYSTSADTFEKTVEPHSHLRMNYIQDYSNPMGHIESNCIIVHEYFDENSERIVVDDSEEPTDLSSRRSASISNMCILDDQMHVNVYTNNPASNSENFPADLSGKNKEVLHSNMEDSMRTSQYLGSSGAINNTICNYDNFDTRQSSDQIYNLHYDPQIRTQSETNFTRSSNRRSISYCEPIEHFDSTSNTGLTSSATCDLSLNNTSMNESTNYERINYSPSEMPLSLVSNSVIDTTDCNSSLCNSMTNVAEYETTTTPYTLANDCISLTKTEPTCTNAIAANVKPPSANTNTETVIETTVNEPCNSALSNNISTQQSFSDNQISESIKLPVCNVVTPTTNSISDTDERNVGIVNVSNSIPVSSDHDPETARKIAMLPKELVEILGTMPIDHRNQLLNVLPQYVSTSTSPVSLSNTSESVRCSSRSSSVNLTSTKTGKEFFESSSEDGRINNNIASSKNLHFSGSSPTSVSSSILLTPPTPQMSERYPLQYQESCEIKRFNVRTSRVSTEEQTPTSLDSTKLNTGSNMVAVKRLTNAIEYNIQDRIIDLTVDENSSENTDVNNVGSVIHTNLITTPIKEVCATAAISKLIVQKTGSDKTASLRAVRIKTPSERHRSMLAESALVKTQSKNAVNITEQYDTNKDSDNISPMAIQQAEVTSTQHRPMSKTSPKLADTRKEDLQQTEKILLVKNDNDETSALHHKLNIVTSSPLKEMNPKYKKDSPSIVCEEKSIKTFTSIECIDVSSSKKPYNDIHDNGIQDVSRKENSAMENHLPVLSKVTTKDSSLVEDEDSEDDVSLAVIVKQKYKDLNQACVANQNTNVAIENKQVNKRKKRNKKNDKSDLISSDKTSLENKVEFSSNKNIHSKMVSESSSINKDNICNENNFIDKVAFCKNNGRKGRRLNNAQIIKYSDKKEQIINTNDYENDINKENNISSDITINNEPIEEAYKYKSIDQDINRSTSVNTIISTDNNNKESVSNIQSKKDKGKKMLDLDKISGQSTDENPEITKDVKENLRENKICNLPQNDISSPCVEISTLSKPHKCTEEEKVLHNVDRSDDPIEIIKFRGTNLKLDNTKIEKSTHDFSCMSRHEKSCKTVNIEYCSTNNVNSEQEETSVTPLRRSRRGKSLFIDTNSTIADNPVSRDNVNEHRAPLTKKQLIFSKLLLDEENHNRTSLNNAPIVLEKSPNQSLIKTSMPYEEKTNQVSSTSNTSNKQEVEVENFEETSLQTQTKILPQNGDNGIDKKSLNKFKTNKRKISPQSKRKFKKKKSFGNQNNIEDTHVETQQKTNVKSEVNKESTSNEDLISVTELLPRNEKDLIDKDNSARNIELVTNARTSFDSTETTSKPCSIEKRKSCSPSSESESLQSSKPKKCKLNDENEGVVFASESKEKEKGEKIELKTTENENSVSISRNITCYNKPARRARSKSVVVKSSSTEFYDPYDIDLEDMVDKAEPFDRTAVTAKMSFSSFKSSIVAKTRKLIKTAPSAIIDISPSECLEIIPSKDADESNLVNVKDRHCHKNTLNRKDSDSDESTKSDVPLKKYVDDKEKRLSEIPLTTDRNKKPNDNTSMTSEKLRNKTKTRKKTSQTISTNKNEEKIDNNKDDNEKDLRSEQFMESFGFFSERKPRKSNLLASKKISETFHIIANDNDDVFLPTKERVTKKGDNKNLKGSSGASTKKSTKRGRKKKSSPPIEPRYCNVCKKAFRRTDNLLRHQMTLYHVSRLCEVELKVKAVLIEEEPNYLIAYRQQLERLKGLQDKIAKRKKNSLPTSDIVLPTLEEILADVKRTIREQEMSRRQLSRDQALFLDCCEMLKQSHKKEIPTVKRVRQCNSFNCSQTCEEQLALLEKSIDDKCEIKNDEDVDSITANNIFESDEVRNLEKDLISNLKEASGLKGLTNVRIQPSQQFAENVAEEPASASNYRKTVNFETIDDATTKPKRHTEVKEKMYPDILDTSIDMFEDKFDKIKRKCRSQAAAAKQTQTQVDPNPSYKNRKKSDKKKGKKSSKKSQNTVPTKGALKGFDGIKVSISTSDINMSAIVPPVANSLKKKKKINSKKKRERKSSDVSSKSDSDHVTKESPQKKVDVYEFLDTEEADLFEFRPSTLMERFKSISNKELPSTSKAQTEEITHSSSESVSDGDDFVYMDDLLFSEDETENSVLSCELGCGKGSSETKKSSPLKRKDVIEKNAVMGKIFKHNAVRSDRKTTKSCAKPKANLDQLFDSLLESEPKEDSKITDEPKEDIPSLNTRCSLSPPKKDIIQSKLEELSSIMPPRKPEPISSVTPIVLEPLISKRNAAAKKYDSSKEYNHSTFLPNFDGPFNRYKDLDGNDYTPKFLDSLHTRDNDYSFTKHKSKLFMDKSSTKRKSEDERGTKVFRAESPERTASSEDAGVARQRARRKCTVGKQNVLAETWSSESEPDAAPPRPNSAESVIAPNGRKKKGKKREGKSRPLSARKPEGRVPSARARPPPLCWSEGEEEPEHPQQHGWIVGDSHKKLVTMLAHAKGRKRSSDDKRNVLE